MKKQILFSLLIITSTYSFSQNVKYDSLDINNINARINNNGNLFWDLSGSSKFEVPKGSGKHSIFNSTLWIAGLDSIDTLHCAAERYQLHGHDFWSGPVSTIYDTTENDIWKVYKSDIDYFKTHWNQTGYSIPQSISNWPAHGDVSKGQSYYLAPFFDWDSDGNYKPNQGDYPLIKGDEAVFFIINDDRNIHTESGGNKLGIEVHCMAYAFDCPTDSALNNSIFINYKIINRSQNSYHNVYIGVFSDFEIGCPDDDYVGSDVQRSSFYAYNGDNNDTCGNLVGYGINPPAQAVTFLAGAYMPADSIDNPLGQCDSGYNGYGFGNTIVDDERYGLSMFMSISNSDSLEIQSAKQYNYLRGYFNDTTRIQYGGNAHSGVDSYGPDCNYMFPGNSDTCNYGTGGVPPYGPVYWTEGTAANMPSDRRGLGSTGPFAFMPGDTQELDIAFILGQDFFNKKAGSEITVMQERIDSILHYFKNDSTPNGGSFSAIADQPHPVNKQFTVFPNPASDILSIELSIDSQQSEYTIYNIVGEKAISGKIVNSNKGSINVSALKPGLYFIKVCDGKNTFSRKFIKQ